MPYTASRIRPTVQSHQKGYLSAMSHALLRIPLAAKLAGANALIALAALAAANGTGAGAEVVLVLTLALIMGIAVNIVLVAVALRPIRSLEETAQRVSAGDFEARVEESAVADERIARVGRILNALLDRLTADRARVRALAADVIGAAERERAGVARELHDGVAQSIAAMTYQLSALEREVSDESMRWRLSALRAAAGVTMEEVRLLAHTMHPRVLDDLGLVAGLRYLARTVSEATETPVSVQIAATTEAALERMSKASSSVLYRVAQEALQNAVRHGAASHIEICVTTAHGRAALEVRDDGRGFDPGANGQSTGLGMRTMRERVGLVDGEFALQTAPGAGTVVRALVPVAT